MYVQAAKKTGKYAKENEKQSKRQRKEERDWMKDVKQEKGSTSRKIFKSACKKRWNEKKTTGNSLI